MYREFSLAPAVWHENGLDFEWDPETGGLRGKDADRVMDMVHQAIKDGHVVSHPYPTHYEIHNPLRHVGEMAVVLGQYWILPSDLLKEIPLHEEDAPADCVQ